MFAQWVNSYKRLVPGYEAPVYVAWSQRNRSALIRIPLYKPGSEQATRAEIRCPDPACNPYLTFAALLHAGLEGIEKGYELPDPMETNLYHLTAEQRRERGIVALPETLGEAIDELSQSELARKALGPHIFDRYIEIKRKEWDEYRVQLTAVGAGAVPQGSVTLAGGSAALGARAGKRPVSPREPLLPPSRSASSRAGRPRGGERARPLSLWTSADRGRTVLELVHASPPCGGGAD